MYDSYFKLNNQKTYQFFTCAKFNAPCDESDYVKNNITSRKADIIEFAFNGKTLLLNFNEKKRVY